MSASFSWNYWENWIWHKKLVSHLRHGDDDDDDDELFLRNSWLTQGVGRNTHHCRSPTHCEQDLNLRRILSWGFGEWSCVVVTTTTPRRHSIAGVTHGATRAPSHRTSTINKIILIKCPFPLHSQISIFLASTVQRLLMKIASKKHQWNTILNTIKFDEMLTRNFDRLPKKI